MTEAEVYRAVGLPYIEPELRENRGEIEAAAAGKLPKLVELEDLRGDLHVHSVRHRRPRHASASSPRRGTRVATNISPSPIIPGALPWRMGLIPSGC